MPFTKDTASEAGKKSVRYKRAKTEAWENIVGWLVGNGGDLYLKHFTDLAHTKKPKDLFCDKARQEFMDRYERLLEYHKPKLARTELTGKGGKTLKVQLIQYADNNNSTASTTSVPSSNPQGC